MDRVPRLFSWILAASSVGMALPVAVPVSAETKTSERRFAIDPRNSDHRVFSTFFNERANWSSVEVTPDDWRPMTHKSDDLVDSVP